MEETQNCARTLLSAGVLRYLLRPEDRQTPESSLTAEQVQRLSGDLLYPIADVLQRCDTFVPTREQILESHGRFRDGWTASRIHKVAIVPLLNFSADLPLPVHLSKNYELTSFSHEEKGWVASYLDAFHSWDMLPFHSFLGAEFTLAGSRNKPRLSVLADGRDQAVQEFMHSHQQMLNELGAIVTALRLVKAGDVAMPTYIEHDNEVPPFGGYPGMRIPGSGLPDFQARRHGSTYTLSQSDVHQVSSLVEALSRLDARPQRGGLEVGLRRFSQSYSRDFYEDRMIDLTVALESTLLAGSGSKDQLRFRFALHGAALLAHSRDPHEVNKFLLQMYDARSSFVHDGKSIFELDMKKHLSKLQPKDFVQTCEDLVRAVLSEYVRQLGERAEGSVETVNRTLDKRISTLATVRQSGSIARGLDEQLEHQR